ncbi:MAG TPA: NAD-dependent epimerase/dehydratase family protein [Terriglobales bacterium]
MTQPTATVVVTGIAGNLGTRLLPMLSEFRVVGVDVRPPEASQPMEFHAINLGHESSCRELTQVLRHTGARSVVHLAFVLDPQQAGVLDVERMWQINVAGTARVMEAISVVNRTGGHVRQFIFPSSVSAYGPETPGPVMEDFPLRAHTLPYAIHKRESDEVVRYRAESMGDCRTYILRPQIFTGAAMQDYMVGALRGIPLGNSPRAARMRAEGKRLPIMLPRGKKYDDRRFQFVHVDDVARLLVYLLHRPHSDPAVTILNVAAHGEPLSIQTCAEIAHAKITRVPNRAAYRLVLRMLWKWGLSSIPPEALPYLIGSYTVNTDRLQQFLGADYSQVMHYSVEDALRDSFRHP